MKTFEIKQCGGSKAGVPLLAKLGLWPLGFRWKILRACWMEMEGKDLPIMEGKKGKKKKQNEPTVFLLVTTSLLPLPLSKLIGLKKETWAKNLQVSSIERILLLPRVAQSCVSP